MIAKGFATVMAGSLVCSIVDADWYFSIRRVDGKTHGPFFSFHHGKEASPADVAQYLPNWNNLQWIEINDSILGKSESYGKDVDFIVNVQSTKGGSKTHKEIVDAFLSFMRNV